MQNSTFHHPKQKQQQKKPETNNDRNIILSLLLIFNHSDNIYEVSNLKYVKKKNYWNQRQSTCLPIDLFVSFVLLLKNFHMETIFKVLYCISIISYN